MFQIATEPTGWQELPVAVLHPDASALVAERVGVDPSVLDALVDGEVYVDPVDGGFYLWPWYPEQDDELRAGAEARGRDLAVGLPPFLDDPYESAFYLRFTGLDALRRLAEEHGIEESELYVREIPIISSDGPYGDVQYEGGRSAAHPAVQRLESVNLAAQTMQAVLGREREYEEYAFRRLGASVRAYGAALAGRAFERGSVRIALEGEPETEFAPPPKEPSFGRCWAVDRGVLIAAGEAVVRLADGEVVGTWICPGEVVFASKTTVLTDAPNGLCAMNLDTGTWLAGPLDPRAAFGGPLTVPSFCDDFFGRPALYDDMFFTADARYGLPFEGRGIVRLEDANLVTGRDPFGSDWDPPATSDVPTLAPESDLSEPGSVRVVLDGVEFTHRRHAGYRVVDERACAIALRGDRWRAYHLGNFWDGDTIVARMEVRIHHAALDEDGGRLWLVGATHLHEVEWDEVPVLVRSTPLSELARAVEELHA